MKSLLDPTRPRPQRGGLRVDDARGASRGGASVERHAGRGSSVDNSSQGSPSSSQSYYLTLQTSSPTCLNSPICPLVSVIEHPPPPTPASFRFPGPARPDSPDGQTLARSQPPTTATSTFMRSAPSSQGAKKTWKKKRFRAGSLPSGPLPLGSSLFCHLSCTALGPTYHL